MISDKIDVAREYFSSDSPKTNTSFEIEELELEFENSILPDIYAGLCPEGSIEKIIRIGDWYVSEPNHKKTSLYLRYYYFLVARYLLEKKYKTSRAEEDLAALNAFTPKFEQAKEEYNNVRDNSIPREIRLIKEFVESAETLFMYKPDTEDKGVMLGLSPNKKNGPGYNLFFFPESDFYGHIDGIDIKLAKYPDIFYEDWNEYIHPVEYVDFVGDVMQLYNQKGNRREVVAELNINGLDSETFLYEDVEDLEYSEEKPIPLS